MSTIAIRRAGPRQWAGLALLALPTALLGLDVTVLYLALPSMTAALDPSAAQTLWIMDAYGFLIAGCLITMGTLGDRIGRRRLLLIGTAAFAIVSVFAAFAPSAELLIAARALLGVAGAALMPSTLSLIANMFTDVRQRAVAIGVWATMFALGMAAGPVIGGALVDAFWWGAAFLIAVPIALAVLAGGKALLPEYADPQAGRLDPASVALSLAAILPAVYAVKHAASSGVGLGTVILLAVSAIGGAVFVRRQRGLASPLLDVGLFAERAFTAALAVLLIGLIGVGGTMYLVTQYLQLVEGLTPFAAGLRMGPPALTMLAAAVGAPLIARRVRPGLVMAAALGLSVIGYALLASAGTGEAAAVVTGFALVYLGLGALAALGTDMVVGAAPAAKSGSAAAMSETVQELGVAVGIALLGSLTTALYASRVTVPPDAPPEVADRLTGGLPGALSVADELPPETVREAQEAFTAGVNIASAAAGLAIAAAAVLCLAALRHVRPLGEEQEVGADARCIARLRWSPEEGSMGTSEAPAVDGRRARGEKRRAEIIEATLAVVTRDGAAGVTHRAVAKQAGITTSLSTYYFATLDDLLVAALSSVAETYTARIRKIIDGPGDKLLGLAELIADSDGPERERALAERELSTLAARRPALAPVARRWRENVAELAAALTDDPRAVAALVGAADGRCAAILIASVPPDTDYVYNVLSQAVGAPRRR